jgi:hypothetical protein
MDDGLLLASFLGVDRRKEELIDETVVVEDRRMVLGLEPAHDPKSPFLGFFEGVESAGRSCAEMILVDDLDGAIGGSLAAMYYLRLQRLFQTEEEIVEHRMNLTIPNRIVGYFEQFYSHFLKSLDIYYK